MMTNISQLNDGFINITVIIIALVILTIVSILYGHTLGETLYRLAIMYVVAIGNTMVLYFFNPFGFNQQTMLLTLNIFMLYFTLRQLARAKGLVALNQHHYYDSK